MNKTSTSVPTNLTGNQAAADRSACKSVGLMIPRHLEAEILRLYHAVVSPQLVWESFGSWLRTIRPGIPPSELVVATALRQRLPQFLLDIPEANIFTKFILDRQDQDKIELFRMTA